MKEAVVLRVLEDELVAYDPVADRTVLMNASSAAVLELCDGRGLASITEEIRERFPDHPDLTSSVLDAVKDLVREGIVVRDTDRATDLTTGPTTGRQTLPPADHAPARER